MPVWADTKYTWPARWPLPASANSASAHPASANPGGVESLGLRLGCFSIDPADVTVRAAINNV